MVQGGGPVNLQAGGSSGFVGISSRNNQQAFNASGQGALVISRSVRCNNWLSELAKISSTRSRHRRRVAFRRRLSAVSRAAAVRISPTPIANGTPLPRLGTAITKAPGLTTLGPVGATLEGSTAVLRGRVATEADRQLAEGIARLEPAVSAVRNELVVGSAPATTLDSLPSPASSRP